MNEQQQQALDHARAALELLPRRLSRAVPDLDRQHYTEMRAALAEMVAAAEGGPQ